MSVSKKICLPLSKIEEGGSFVKSIKGLPTSKVYTIISKVNTIYLVECNKKLLHLLDYNTPVYAL